MSLHTYEGSAAVADVSLGEVLAGLETLGVSVVVTDLAGTILAWSDASAALFGWSADQVLGFPVSDITRSGVSQADAASVLLTGDGAPWWSDVDVVRADGAVVRVRVSASLAGPDKDLVLALARPLGPSEAGTPQKAPQKDRRGVGRPDAPPMASYDPLTGLPNRSHLTEWLSDSPAHEDGRGAGLAVLFVDIDRFNLVNDNRGHAAGDALLIAVAARLAASCRPTDTVARVGDDEFVLIRTETNAEQARRFAEDIRRTFDDPCDAGDTQVAVSVSIGIATTDDVPVADVLQSAERALNWAKASGSGRIELHSPTMRCSTEGRLQLLTDLKQAIKAGTLNLHYQPIVQAGGRVTGVEALLRWSHPRHGTVSPADVICLAEDNGLMPDMGAWILNRACSDIAKSVNTTVAALEVAVNLSTRQLADPNIVETVRKALSRSHLPAERLVLEVTETSVIANPETTSRHLHALKRLGVRLALDDFGTGYSSLVHVRSFPVDIIKIDRSFIAGISTNNEDFAIVASLINLAGAVGLDVVAEGVETPGQAEILRRLGCTYMQGYLWSRAVPVTDLAALLQPDALHRPTQGALITKAGTATAVSSADYDTRGRILALHRAGFSLDTIAGVLNAESRRTQQGQRWRGRSVARVLAENA